MAVYTVFEPPDDAGDTAEHAERFVFVRERFSWAAFFFGPLWMLWHGLWLVLLGYIVVMAALEAGLRLTGGGNARVLVAALIALLLGFEAVSLRRWTLLRRRWRELGTVIGDDLEAAERRFFDAWVAGQRGRKAPSSLAPPPMRRSAAPGSDVIGLFPEPGGGR